MIDKRIFYEPKFRRWHTTVDCRVIRAQEQVELVLCKEAPPHSRPCAICGSFPVPCD